MLKLTIILSEAFDNEKGEFVEETVDIELEHSLASLSKWEMIWEVPLVTTKEKTDEMNRSYLECMCLTPNVPPEVFDKLDESHQLQISNYLERNHTATWFSNDNPQAKGGEALTAELIYYWMSSFNINWEAQYWNLSRLLTLIKIFSLKQDNKPKKMNTMARRMDMVSEIQRRKAEMGSNG